MKIIIKGADFKDNNLESTTISKYYSVTYSGSGVSSSSAPKTIAYGDDNYAVQDLVATIKVLSSYTFNSVTSVSVGGKALSTSDYTVSGQIVTVPANKINGNVTINVSAEKVNTEPEEPGTGGAELTKIETKQGIVSANSALGATVQWGVTGVGTGTSTKYLIPAGTEVTIKVTNTGNYAFARTNMDEIVIDICISQSLSSGEYTFGAINSDTYLFTSDNKIISIESEISNDYIIYPVEFKKTGLISGTQTIGSEISIVDQSGVFYTKYLVPAGKSCKIKIKGGGNYGMVLTDLNNVVVEFTKSISSNDVSVITEYTFGAKEHDCYFYAATNKFDSFF